VAHQKRAVSSVVSDPRFGLLLAQTLKRMDDSRPAQQNQFMSALVSLAM
jgi:hypothetical protein